jgi:hypothetical protein
MAISQCCPHPEQVVKNEQRSSFRVSAALGSWVLMLTQLAQSGD